MKMMDSRFQLAKIIKPIFFSPHLEVYNRGNASKKLHDVKNLFCHIKCKHESMTSLYYVLRSIYSRYQYFVIKNSKKFKHKL